MMMNPFRTSDSMTRGTGSDYRASELVLLEYVSGRVRNKILIDIKCLISCLDRHIGARSSIELFTHVSTIINNLISLIDDGWKFRRAVYNSIYTLLKYVGFRNYFDIAKIVDECSTCFRSES